MTYLNRLLIPMLFLMLLAMQAQANIAPIKPMYPEIQEVTVVSEAWKELPDLCAMPIQRLGYEDNTAVIMPPECVIADDIGELRYLETQNLSRVLDKYGNPVAEHGAKAVYETKNGRCTALFIKHQSAEEANKALQSGLEIKKTETGSFYTDEKSSFATWPRENYVITAGPDMDYSRWKYFEIPCTQLIEPYMKKIGSDLKESSGYEALSTGQSPIQACTMQEGNEGSAYCTEATNTGQEPDENGMIMDCDVNETGTVVCTKIPAGQQKPAEIVQEQATSQITAMDLPPEESPTDKIRRVAEEKNIKLPDYNDEQLNDALQEFGAKLEPDQKYENEPEEKIIEDVLRQFSEKTEQRISLMQKVRNFFKKLF